MPTWTPQQQQAIDARNNTILVSAAAGSGKTAVLVERIVQLIREGWRLDRMLIVTFTKAAASEMRQRLNKRLVKEAAADPERMGQALDDLESTEISTIHAFCQKVLRNNFQAVGIDPMVRACDEQQKNSLFQEAWLAAFNELLEERADEDFMELAYAWDQAQLQDMTAQLYDFLMSLPAPYDWLDRAVAHVTWQPFRLHPWYQVIHRSVKIELEGVGVLLDAMRKMLDEPNVVENRRETWESDALEWEKLRTADLDDPNGLLNAVNGFTMAKVKPARGISADQKEWLERFAALRKQVSEIIKHAQQLLDVNPETMQTEFTMMQRHLRGMSALVKRTAGIFLEKKAEQHVIDFSDMEQFTMTVLQDPTLRAQIQSEYDHIFVDECQDVSQVQDAILQSIHHEGNCMFMVGDVKQSIYRFRKADPTLFMHRLRTFHDEEDAHNRRIILQKNFRSRANVLEATNQVFRTVMRPDVTELTYFPEDELICGRETEDDPSVEMHLLDASAGEDGEAIEALEAEAQVVIERIHELLNEQFDDGSGLRNYTYRDMVILLSAASNTAPKLVELLGRAGIPVYYDGAASFFELAEVRSIKALLSVIDNPMQDVPLLAALKMPPFSLTDSNLASIRTAKTGRNVPFYEAFEEICTQEGALADKCRAVRVQLEGWRFEADAMRLSDFIWHVIEDSGYYAAVGAQPKGALRQANLRMLFQRALDFEQNQGGTLSDFLLLTDKQSAADDRTSAKMLGENENLLRIMTMHKSKGLEFPIVFCMQMSGRLHKPFRGEMLMHTQLGVALPYINRELRIKRKTIANEAFRVQRELDDKAERARLLYVAMTRAREKLIMIGCCKGNERDLWHMPESDYAVWNARSMTDWIMQGLIQQNIHNLSTGYPQDGKPWNIRLWSDLTGVAVDNPVEKVELDAYLQGVLTSAPGAGMFAWMTDGGEKTAAPIKTSVSAIAKKAVTNDPMPLTVTEEDADDKRVQEEIVSPLRMSELPSRPAFLEEKRMTGAERGTLTHRALSLIPLDMLRQADRIDLAVKQALHDMAEREIFTYQELMVLDLWGIADYFRSDVGSRMLRSETVRREWSFNLLMDDHQGTLLQGVIDCAFLEDGQWVLVDYKTDHITDEDAFRERYAMQMAWYAKALAKITGKDVKEVWLYAIGKRKAYRMDVTG